MGSMAEFHFAGVGSIPTFRSNLSVVLLTLKMKYSLTSFCFIYQRTKRGHPVVWGTPRVKTIRQPLLVG